MNVEHIKVGLSYRGASGECRRVLSANVATCNYRVTRASEARNHRRVGSEFSCSLEAFAKWARSRCR